jgi:hypothetical protein
MPAGEKAVYDNENNYTSKPYLQLLHKKSKATDRTKQIKLFGPGFTDHKEDTFIANLTGEMTNDLVGANEFFVGRRNDFYAA